MNIAGTGTLEADDDILIQSRRRDYALVLGVYQPGGMTIYADRVQLTRLRDAITAALDTDAEAHRGQTFGEMDGES